MKYQRLDHPYRDATVRVQTGKKSTTGRKNLNCSPLLGDDEIKEKREEKASSKEVELREK